MIYTKYLLISILLFVILLTNDCENMNNDNCYSYAFNNTNIEYKDKPQPGEYSNIKQVRRNNKEYKCNKFIYRVLMDYPDSRFISVNDYKKGKRCNDREYAIFLSLDNKGVSTDYHFYKEDDDGYWSHKPGLDDVSFVDDSGKKITNPLYADRNYENEDINNPNKYNYDISCGFFCKKK